MQKLKLSFGGHSVAGLKEENQDAFTAHLPDEHAARKFKGGVACIADGVSNSRNAKVASQTAVTNFAMDYFSTPDYWTVKQSAKKVISAINAWLYRQGHQNHIREDGYVTTFSTLVIKSHTAHLLHVGDSRIYRLRDNKLEQLTRDHSFFQGERNSLTRALGFDPQLELDYSSVKVHEGDVFFLTTDGLHEHLSTEHFIDAVNDSEDLETASKRLIKQALDAGSDDNVSCLIVTVDGLPIERLTERITDVAGLVIPHELEAGNKLDHYEIKHMLHRSTRSHVYLARDLNTDTRVVLKVPSLNFTDDQNYRESFAREQWIGRKLSHPHIVSINPPPPNTKFLYHACEYIEGQTLRQWMIDNPKPELEQVRQILEQMVKPVRTLKRHQMVHRDLKPENFMIDRDGRVMLIDLGTVKIAGLDEININDELEQPEGDMHYIAPEVLVDRVSSWRSDLFSIASIVYEMVSGGTPYNCVKSSHDHPTKYSQWKYRPLNTQTSRKDLPQWLDRVLKQALDPRPNNRFDAFSEFEKEMSKPSKATLSRTEHRPLVERNPLLAWKLLATILLISNLVCLYFLLSS